MEGVTGSVARHYTICNAMQPEFYKALVCALKDQSDSEYKAFDARILNSESSN